MSALVTRKPEGTPASDLRPAAAVSEFDLRTSDRETQVARRCGHTRTRDKKEQIFQLVREPGKINPLSSISLLFGVL
ncbi:hypothetical protein [Dinoroseobacter shibae]|uniref:hypothetical protein n=1 Tax=Dinoroseobacter shibae TaxID=215813 RepID=UPI0005C56294|nr:hypothetical protein [Dinoroseobacter shibae]URF45524.1 hypothetical protein M8008_12120 [Dinoroseobacter shibae]URF49829.1 hypothetical protein M8007_12120 [Dinoroseobacter shibae]